MDLTKEQKDLIKRFLGSEEVINNVIENYEQGAKAYEIIEYLIEDLLS